MKHKLRVSKLGPPGKLRFTCRRCQKSWSIDRDIWAKLLTEPSWELNLEKDVCRGI